jgi:hypothetical protein
MLGTLLGFFTAGPARVAGLIYGAGALLAAIAVVGLLALWWRGEMIQARAERDLARAQIAVLAMAVETCNSSVDHAKRAADAAVAGTASLLAEARRLKTPARHTVERIERIIKEPAPPGADCNTAWQRIEGGVR